MTAIAAIQIARKQLGLDEDTTRDLYGRVTGKRSLRDMSSAEQELVIAEMRRQGFTKSSNGARKPLEGKFAKKLQALWIAAWNLGVVENRDDHALLAFVKRQTGIDHVRFLHDAADARKAIEALKAWMAREAGIDWTVNQTLPAIMNDERFRVAWAQYRRIVPGATFIGNMPGFLYLTGDMLGKSATVDLAKLTRRDWQTLMNDLGCRIRKAKAG